MPVKYKNPSAGKRCDGVCDYCGNYSEFIFHSFGTFCEKCCSNMKKFKVRVPNFFKTDYCLLCHARPSYLWRVNYGFCRRCMHRIGVKTRIHRDEERKTTKRKLRKINKKIKYRELTPKEAEKKEKEMKKNA